ncbi:cytochrome c oxidase assembly factor 6 homolog [Cloeon dipterum]
MPHLNKEERSICWKSRDDYWKCLDKAEASKQLDPEKACQDLYQVFASKCPGQWVKHFERKRKFEVFKKRIVEEGFEPIPEEKK